MRRVLSEKDKNVQAARKDKYKGVKSRLTEPTLSSRMKSMPTQRVKENATQGRLRRVTGEERGGKIRNEEVERRMRDLETYTTGLKGKVKQGLLREEAFQERLEEGEERIVRLEGEIQAKREELGEFREREMEWKARLVEMEGIVAGREQEVGILEGKVREGEEALRGMVVQLQRMEGDLKERGATMDELLGLVEQLEEKLGEKDTQMAELREEAIEHEQTRKALHNRIQELRGNVRVFCRVRPALRREIEGGLANQAVMQALEKCDGRKLAVDASGKRVEFEYDRVFSGESRQAEVFAEISQLVQSALDGYNTCIFSYGQTNSGKTYTMEGPSVNPADEERGMIARSIEQIFRRSTENAKIGWEYQYMVNYIEIYNEAIRDLLVPKQEKMEIHHTKAGTRITHMEQVRVECPEDVYKLLGRAKQNRSIGETKANVHSSRSHSIFQMTIRGKNAETGEAVRSVLSMIDLAGSERLSVSQAEGERLRETQSINKSLSALGDVIQALGREGGHVPFRNSKLTFLLKQSLGGNCKTLMFVNISPLAKDLKETMSSLRFASKVNQCDIGSARRQ